MTSIYVREVAPLSAAINLSTLTVLAGWTKYSNDLEALLFAFLNLSATETITFTVETSEDASSSDTEHVYTLTAPPLSQASMEIQGTPLRSYYRFSGNTQGPSFNAAQAKYMVRAGRLPLR